MSERILDEYYSRVLKSAATFCARWVGARAELREVTTSHKTATILLTKESSAQNLLVSCIDPIRIEAPVRWENATLSVVRAELSNQDAGFLITDPNGPLSIRCGSVEFAENVKLR